MAPILRRVGLRAPPHWTSATRRRPSQIGSSMAQHERERRRAGAERQPTTMEATASHRGSSAGHQPGRSPPRRTRRSCQRAIAARKFDGSSTTLSSAATSTEGQRSSIASTRWPIADRVAAVTAMQAEKRGRHGAGERAPAATKRASPSSACTWAARTARSGPRRRGRSGPRTPPSLPTACHQSSSSASLGRAARSSPATSPESVAAGRQDGGEDGDERWRRAAPECAGRGARRDGRGRGCLRSVWWWSWLHASRPGRHARRSRPRPSFRADPDAGPRIRCDHESDDPTSRADLGHCVVAGPVASLAVDRASPTSGADGAPLARRRADVPIVGSRLVATWSSGVRGRRARSSRNPVGWLFLALGTGPRSARLRRTGTSQYAPSAASGRPLPGSRGARRARRPRAGSLWFMLVALILFLTPTGHSLSAAMAVRGLVADGGRCRRRLPAGDPVRASPSTRRSRTSRTRSRSQRLQPAADRLGTVCVSLLGLGLIAAAVSSASCASAAPRGDERRQLLWLVFVVAPLPLYVVVAFALRRGHYAARVGGPGRRRFITAGPDRGGPLGAALPALRRRADRRATVTWVALERHPGGDLRAHGLARRARGAHRARVPGLAATSGRWSRPAWPSRCAGRSRTRWTGGSTGARTTPAG